MRAPVHMEVKVDDARPLPDRGRRAAAGRQPADARLACCTAAASSSSPPATTSTSCRCRTRDVDYARYDRYAARIVSGIQPVALPQVRALHGLDEVEALPSFVGTGLLRRPGMPLAQTIDLRSKSYEVYLLHADAEQVAHDAQAVRQLLRYE